MPVEMFLFMSVEYCKVLGWLGEAKVMGKTKRDAGRFEQPTGSTPVKV